MKLFEIAMGKPCTCGLCKLLDKYGGTTPESIREFNLLRERNGYKGKPVHGKDWVRLLEEHEADHLKRGEKLPDEWTVRGLPQAFKDSLVVKRPVVRVNRPVVNKDEAAAYAKFLQVAKPVVHQRNGRKMADPVAKLDPTPFKGF